MTLLFLPTRAQAPNIENKEPDLNGLILIQNNSLDGRFIAPEAPVSDFLTKEEIIPIIEEKAAEYGVSSWLMTELARLESQFLIFPYGDGGRAKGLYHYWDDTFYRYAEIYEIKNPDIWNVEQQIELTALLIRDGKGPKEWVNSYKKLGLL